MTGALHGLQVVALTVGVAGPVAGMLLADHGAAVIKVEPPEEDPARSDPGFQVWNPGKVAIEADLDDGDRREVARLLGVADVVLVGSSPDGIAFDDLERRGLGPRPPATWVVLPPYLLGHTPWVGGREAPALVWSHLGHAWNQASHDDVPVDSVYPIAAYLQDAGQRWPWPPPVPAG